MSKRDEIYLTDMGKCKPSSAVSVRTERARPLEVDSLQDGKTGRAYDLGALCNCTFTG